MLGKAMFIALYQMGVQVDHFEDTDDGIIFLFSVPKTSYEHDANGKEMSGKHLASVIKLKYEVMGMRFADIRYGVRNEHWDKTKAEAAKKTAYRELGYKKWQYEKEGL